VRFASPQYTRRYRDIPSVAQRKGVVFRSLASRPIRFRKNPKGIRPANASVSGICVRKNQKFLKMLVSFPFPPPLAALAERVKVPYSFLRKCRRNPSQVV
jgi:hypothetical protein